MNINNPVPPTSNVAVTSPLGSDNADAQASKGTNGLVAAAAALLAYNGTTHDLVRSVDEGAGVGSLAVERFGDSITNNGSAFGGAYQQAAAAGVYSVVQLWNPTGSGIVVYCHFARAYRSTAGLIQAALTTTQAANLSAVGKSLKGGGTAAKADIRHDNPAAVPGGSFAYGMQAAYIQTDFDFKCPIILPEGYGLTLLPDGYNILLGASYLWREL